MKQQREIICSTSSALTLLDFILSQSSNAVRVRWHQGERCKLMNFSVGSKLMKGHCTPFTHSQSMSGVSLDQRLKLIHSKRLIGHFIKGQNDHCAEQDATLYMNFTTEYMKNVNFRMIEKL